MEAHGIEILTLSLFYFIHTCFRNETVKYFPFYLFLLVLGMSATLSQYQNWVQGDYHFPILKTCLGFLYGGILHDF